MKFKTTLPPVYERCRERFGVSFDDGIAFAYGDTVHCALSEEKIPKWKIIHEATHLDQQVIGADLWWNKYLEDPVFRLSQEVEAYRNEVHYLKHNMRNRDLKAKLILFAARDLSSRMYGNLVSFKEAQKLLK